MHSLTRPDAHPGPSSISRPARAVVSHPIATLLSVAVGSSLVAVALMTALTSAPTPAASQRSTQRAPLGARGGPGRQSIASGRVDLGALWGRALRGHASAYESLAKAEADANQTPPGATVNHAANSIRFAGAAAAITIVANPPTGHDMAFRAAGLENPTIEVRRDTRVSVRFINGDSDSAHGWLLLDPVVEIGNTVHGPRAFPGAFAPILGDPTSAGHPVETITFRATQPGAYRYECPVPGHAAMGMKGNLVVSS